MEFLRPLLRRHFARAQVATLRDVSCFLRLDVMMNMCILYLNAQLDECDFGFGLSLLTH